MEALTQIADAFTRTKTSVCFWMNVKLQEVWSFFMNINKNAMYETTQYT